MPRPKGSGKPKGYKAPGTLTKEAARQFVCERVWAEMGPLIEAQVANAKGLKYLVARHKGTGKFERLTEAEMHRILAGEESEHVLIEVWDKDPSVQAFTDLMNRALDKPKEQPQEVDLKGDLVVRWQDD